MHCDRLHARGLPNYRVPGFGLARFRQGSGASHRRFLVRCGENNQWLLQGAFDNLFGGFDGKGEKPFHIANAETVEAAIPLDKFEWRLSPESLVAGYGIGVAGEHQTSGAAAERGDQVGFARIGQGHYFCDKAEVVEPAGKQIYNVAIALIKGRVNTADGVAGD